MIMGIVSIVKVDQGIKEGLLKSLDLIGGLEQFISANDKVMIKPNLNDDEVYTSKEVVASLIQLLFDLKVKKVFIAESTFGNSLITERYFSKTGYNELAKDYGIELINLNKSEPIEINVKNPLVLDKILIAREAYEADKIINIANMKVHYATGVSLAMKNLKGLLVGDEKKVFHEVGLDKAIVDLNSVVKPSLNILDGLTGMERMGPHGGDKVQLDLLLAGKHTVELDYIGCCLIGYQIKEVKHLEYYLRINPLDLKNIKVLGEPIEGVKHPFKKAMVEGIIPQEFCLYNKNACSACMNALLLSCSFLKGEIRDKIDVYLGSLKVEKESGNRIKLGFGNCCPRDIPFDLKIKGCPPYPFTLGETLKDYYSKND